MRLFNSGAADGTFTGWDRAPVASTKSKALSVRLTRFGSSIADELDKGEPSWNSGNRFGRHMEDDMVYSRAQVANGFADQSSGAVFPRLYLWKDSLMLLVSRAAQCSITQGRAKYRRAL